MWFTWFNTVVHENHDTGTCSARYIKVSAYPEGLLLAGYYININSVSEIYGNRKFEDLMLF